jgi:hypothetical protein
MSDIGAMSFGRWHSMQCLLNIGATSLAKVTFFALFFASLAPLIGEATRQSAARKATANEIEIVFFIKILPMGEAQSSDIPTA